MYKRAYLKDSDGWLVDCADNGPAIGDVAHNAHDNVGSPGIKPCAHHRFVALGCLTPKVNLPA